MRPGKPYAVRLTVEQWAVVYGALCRIEALGDEHELAEVARSRGNPEAFRQRLHAAIHAVGQTMARATEEEIAQERGIILRRPRGRASEEERSNA